MPSSCGKGRFDQLNIMVGNYSRKKQKRPFSYVCVVSGFRRDVNENCALSTIRRSHRIGPIGCSNTLVKDYHHTLRNIPEEPTSLLSNACFQGRPSPKPPKPWKSDHNGYVRENLEGDGCGLFEGSYYPRHSSTDGNVKGFSTDSLAWWPGWNPVPPNTRLTFGLQGSDVTFTSQKA